MWKLFKSLFFLVKTFIGLSILFIVLGLLTITVLELELPVQIKQRLTDALSTDNLHVRMDRITYNYRRGLRLHQIKAFPKRVAADPIICADEIAIRFSLLPYLHLNERILDVSIRNIKMPTLPTTSNEIKTAEPITPFIPTLAPFPVLIETADIAGIKADRLTTTVKLGEKNISLSDIVITWPDKLYAMTVAGSVDANFQTRRVNGHLKGQAFPANIMPLLIALKSRGAIRQIDCFSNIERPIDTRAEFTVDMDNSDFTLTLDLDVGPCLYRSVPMTSTRGRLIATGINTNTTVAIESLHAESVSGPISGRLFYNDATEGVDFEANANMELEHLTTILNILNHGELKRVKCNTPIRVLGKGVIAASSTLSTVTNDLTSKLAFEQGSILNFKVKNITGDLLLKDYNAHIQNVSGTPTGGGNLKGNILFFFPNYDATATVFTANLNLADVDLADLSNAFSVTNDRAGFVTGNLHLQGSTHTNTIASLSGQGQIKIRDGLINRMHLFSGLTDYLSQTIPGISSLVSQSSGSMEFKINNGIISTDDFLIEGAVFSIQGRGTYNMDTDQLAFTVRVNIFKQKSIAGRITHFITFPFTRLLMEFKVFGSLDNPDWSYVNIIERISESFSDITTPTPPININSARIQ